MIQHRALAVVLAAIIVTSMVAPFAAVGSAAAAPAGMSTIPDANVAQDVPAGETIPLSASELERGVMASQHADSLEVTLTTADHAASVMDADSAVVSGDGMAVVLRDDVESAGREVALDAGLLQQALGYRPEAIYGTHEDGSEWTATAEYVDGYLVFDVPHFSSNTVTFSGEIVIEGDGITNATQFAYDVSSDAAVSNESLRLTGTLGTRQRTIKQTTPTGNIPLDVGGGVPATNAELAITGNHREIQQSQSGSVKSASTTTQSLSPAGDSAISGTEIQIDASTQSYTDHVYIYTRPGWGRNDPDNNWDFDTNGHDINEVTVNYDIKDSKSTGAESFQFYVQGNQQASWSHETGGSTEEFTNSFSYNYDGGGTIPMSVAPSFIDTSDSTLKINWIKITTDAPSTVSVTPSDGSESTYSVNDGYSATKSIPISKSTSSVDLGVDQGGFDYTIKYTEGHDTEDPQVKIADTWYNHSGVLSNGQTKSWTLPDIEPGTAPAEVSVESKGQVDADISFTERTPTIDPSVRIESGGGVQTIQHTGTLGNGTTVDLSDQVDPSLIGNSTTVTVNVNDPATGPNGRVGVVYRHSAQDKMSTTYQASTFEEFYKVSHTYAGVTENAQVTIPFVSSRVVGVKNLEYRIDGSAWAAVDEANYRFDGTTLDVYLDDATGGIQAGQTVDVRATGRKISVDNGAVTVTDPTAPDEDLDTELRIDSRTPDFAVDVGPTDDGDRVHYAYSNSFPTEDYVVIDAGGNQDLHLPNAVTGDRFRVSHLDTRVVAERGDVRIDVVKAGENPELDVSPGPGGSGDPVTVEYHNTETGVTYLLNSIKDSIVVDSDTAQSPAIFEDDDSEDTWTILRDSGAATTTSGGGGGGIMPTQVSSAASSVSLPLGDSLPTPLLIVGVLGLGAVVVFRRFNPFGGGSSTTTSRSTSPNRSSSSGTNIPGLGGVMGVFGSIRSLLSMIPFSRVVGVVWDTLFGIVSSVARVLWNALRGVGGWLAASTASGARSAGGWVAARLATPAIALGVIAIGVMAAVQAGIIAPPREVRLMLAAVSALIGSAIALRAVGLLNWRFYGIVAGSTFVIIAETLSPGSVLDALGSGLEQTFPIFGLLIAYLVYRRVSSGGGDSSGTTVVVTGGGSGSSDGSSQDSSGGD